MIPNDVLALGPFILAVAVALAVLVADLVAPGKREPVLAISLGGLALVGILTLATGQSVAADAAGTSRVLAFGGAYVVDGLTTFLDLIFVGIVAFTIVFAPDYLEARGLPLAEFSIILLFAMTGAMLIAGAADLLVLFVALELMVLPGYMLAGYHKSDGYSTEGAIKYFLLGSFSSAIFLFGLAFAWGATGTTSIAGVRAALEGVAAGSAALSPALVLGLGFMTTGVAFKI
ncbi:MAG TPA: proton-conducting transporter membrane subunit, partial [Candidatus Limnocylindrales bacterium]